MKKNLFLIISVCSFGIAQSQEISDAVRFSQENINGTARFRAMSGAFGALGGDFSSINVNPAGSAIFANNQMGITISNSTTKNKASYFGSTNTEDDNSFDVNQAGLVFVFNNNRSNDGWNKFSLAINYDNKNNFNNTIGAFGVNPTNSIGDYFLSYANGIPLNSFKDAYYGNLDHASQQAYLAFEAYIIDPANNDPNPNEYISNIAEGGNYYQENTIITNGYNGKLSFNAAAACNDKFYIGINLNSHFVDYTQSSVFYEDNDNPLPSDPDSYRVNKVQFNNDLYTYGSGFSFQLGIIGKITPEARIGLAYESPTWYKLNDELTQSVVAVSSNTSGSLDPDVINPNITNVYAPYKLQTPGKFTTSFAYIFGKTGLLSIDYSLKNYSKTKFKPEYDSYYQVLNNEMDKTLANTSEVRVGGEYKIERLSLRAGYHFQESPYKNKNTIGDLHGYSAGLGYNFGGTKADLSYAYAKRNSNQGFFSQGLTDGAAVNSINNTVTLTLLFEL
ncbi:OmpP1/FadL family transporter [Flavobacterium daejeonense]|uniref:OmpP1/FadL family transporter n=1 Tax=Flavobacterium daejeonense TaxID=350893 RepID=UPI00047DA302|nr:outer membrane protein transport protein [Flavobacterium daejeonense]